MCRTVAVCVLGKGAPTTWQSTVLHIVRVAVSPEREGSLHSLVLWLNSAWFAVQTLELLKGTAKESAEESDAQNKQLALRRQAYHLLQRAPAFPGK